MTASQQRLAQLREKLEGRLDPATGKARPGFAANVREIRQAIGNLEAGRPELSHRKAFGKRDKDALEAQLAATAPKSSAAGPGTSHAPQTATLADQHAPPAAESRFHGIVGGVGAR